MEKTKIILFGGSFDPIHHGHLGVARAVCDQLSPAQLILIPAARSPHKTDAPTDGHHRLAMIDRAIADEPAMAVSDCELTRPAPSYTLETIAFFRHRFGPAADLHWLIGADQLDALVHWYRVATLLDACRVTVMYRAGYPRPDFSRFEGVFRPDQVAQLARDVVQTPLIDISGTAIRQSLAAGVVPREALPEPVCEYIRRHRLYGVTD